MNAGQLALGAVEIVGLGTEEGVLGYAFTVESGAGQLQRWLLWSRPRNAFRVRAVPESMAGWTLEDWQERAPALWREGSYYVWALTTMYFYGKTYGTGTSERAWTSIPGTLDGLPVPTYPPFSGNYQLDPDGGHALSLRTSSAAPGWVYAVGGLTDKTSAEYWLLTDGHVPAGTSSTLEVSASTREVGDLDGFVALANQTWGEGCALAITGCVNYRGDRAPEHL